jgi:type I restriction enzyme S subunit
LARILTERRARWEAKQLARFKEQGKTPPKDWQKKYLEPVQPDTTDLPELPEGWVWASGEQLCEFITKGTTPPNKLDAGGQKTIPFLRVTNLTDRGQLDLTDEVFVSVETHQGFLDRSAVFPNDVLMNIVGPPLGQVAVVPPTFAEWNINQAIAIFRAVEGVAPWIICHYLLSPAAQRWLKARSKTTAGQTNLTLEVCRSLPIPLPPQDEQQALLTGVEAAMNSLASQERSIESALKQSTAQRPNFLRAAFSGQLVPQDPNDEPASVLLERIRAERAAQASVKKPCGRKAKEAA